MNTDKFIDFMVQEHQFNKIKLQQLLQQARKQNSILRAMQRPAEAKPWYDYRKIFITEARIAGGAKFWRQHQAVLAKAAADYGVPAEIIVAIIGVESSYGAQLGNFRVIDALYTLAFNYPRRADYFRGELENFLLLTREEAVNPLLPKGSYAGAMGYGQFMPSSYRNYAVDFNGDGQRNLWNGVEDTIGSVANYLRNYSASYGWQADKEVILATKVVPEAADELLNLEFKPQFSVKELKARGVILPTNQYDDYLALLIDLETETGTLYWLGFNNFYMLTRYNKSNRYAMAVYQLAQEIKARYNAT